MTREEFERLADGLLYMSETDAPLNYFEMEYCQWPPATAAEFLELIGEDSTTTVEQIDTETFFEDLRRGNEDHEDQVEALQKRMKEELRNIRGFRVGEIEIDVFVLGGDALGKVCGLQTLSVET